MQDIVSKDIIAILPVYIADKGNCTIICTNEEDLLLNTSIKTVIRRLCSHYRLDLRASNRYFGELISVRNVVPLPLSKDKIFIQAKVRKPIGKDDGSMGYFELDSIKKIKDIKDNTLVILNNDKEIQCLCKQGTIKKHIKHAELIKKLYDDNQPIVKDAMEYYVTSDTPATKSDIARIFMMIQEIVNKI